MTVARRPAAKAASGASAIPVEVGGLRRFRVHARHEDVRHGRILSEPTFEAAALAYAEHLPVPADQLEAVGVVVHDIDSGQEHSFVIRFETGSAAPASPAASTEPDPTR